MLKMMGQAERQRGCVCAERGTGAVRPWAGRSRRRVACPERSRRAGPANRGLRRGGGGTPLPATAEVGTIRDVSGSALVGGAILVGLPHNSRSRVEPERPPPTWAHMTRRGQVAKPKAATAAAQATSPFHSDLFSCNCGTASYGRPQPGRAQSLPLHEGPTKPRPIETLPVRTFHDHRR